MSKMYQLNETKIKCENVLFIWNKEHKAVRKKSDGKIALNLSVFSSSISLSIFNFRAHFRLEM